MEVRLDGKVMLVTGATQGIGRAIAETAARSGAEGLLITGRNQQRGAAVAAELAAMDAPAAFVAADLGDPETPALLAAACVERFGRIDGLVNAGALTDRTSFVDASLDDWASLFAANARAPFFLMQAAIADMKKRAQGGAIVNILSINAHCGAPDLAVYSATKGALATLTKNAANAHRFDRIRVNGINVGWTDTPAERVVLDDLKPGMSCSCTHCDASSLDGLIGLYARDVEARRTISRRIDGCRGDGRLRELEAFELWRGHGQRLVDDAGIGHGHRVDHLDAAPV